MASQVSYEVLSHSTPVPAAGLCYGHAANEPVTLRRRVKRWLAHRAIRAMMLVHRIAMIVAIPNGYVIRRRRSAEGLEILLTGTFYSDNWVNAHVRPLAASQRCARVLMVSTSPVPQTPKLVAIYPPDWLKRVVGAVPARLLVFCLVALRRRPHIVGGFHLLVNSLVAGVMARMVGAESMYFCVGGPKEVVDGGVGAENRVFDKMETPDRVVERRLVRAVGTFDRVITMGTRAVRFFRERGLRNAFHVVSGGIDDASYAPGDGAPSTDLILVARLVPIKRIDVFLEAVALVASRVPGLIATIVGCGELQDRLSALARDLGVASNVRFVGHQRDVSRWLRSAKVFVLTSDSEGLALSVMEAMMCGVPAIVSDVGDMGDLVEDGVNGFLVQRRSPEAFADRIVELLTSDSKRAAVSLAARRAALRYRLDNVTKQWDEILSGQNGDVCK